MLIDEIRKANVAAMKAHDQNARTAYSMVISAYQALLTSGSGKEVGDADVIRLIMKFGKELDEEKEGYIQANRLEDAAKIAKQKEAISVFLPKMLSEAEIRDIIAKLDDKSIPFIMKHFKTNYDGKVDMGLVNKIARSL